MIGSRAAWADGAPPQPIAAAQADIAWAEHLVFVYPLWLGDMPALLKGFLEQVARPGFAISGDPERPRRLLKGKSARIVVTMGMPAFVYRHFFGAHSVKSFERNILGFVGIRPLRAVFFGSVERSVRRRDRWLSRMRTLGQSGR